MGGLAATLKQTASGWCRAFPGFFIPPAGADPLDERGTVNTRQSDQSCPARVQRKRTSGWRMPPGVVYVGRPGKFGNPYWDVKRFGLELCVAMFRNTARGIWDPSLIPYGPGRDLWIQWLYDQHTEWLKRIGPNPAEIIRAELRGKDLSCWCPPSRACHADILLEIANQ